MRGHGREGFRRRAPGFRAGLVSLASLIAASLSLLLAPIAGATASKGLRVRITFAGSGTLTADVPAEEDVTRVVDSLSWRSTFSAVIDAKGTLTAKGPGVIDEGPGTYSFSDAGMNASCSGSLPLNPYAPNPALSVEGGQVTVQAIGKQGLLAAPGGDFGGCQGVVEGHRIDASPVVAAYAAGFPNAYLPDVLSAHVPVPSLQEAIDNQSFAVSQADAPKQMPSSCADLTEDPGCSLSLSWSGTVTYEAECDARTVINCSKQQAKAAAGKAARRYRHQEHDDQFTYKANGCNGGLSRSSLGVQSGALGACVGAGLRVTYDSAMAQHYMKIANDPPDSHYRKVIRPHPLRAKGLSSLRALSPVAFKLMRRYLSIAGLAAAVVTSQNRASGASEALAKGNGAAARYLAMQNHAVLSYARRASHLLKGQHTLARRAAAQLRHVSKRLHGRGSREAAHAILSFASSLVSKRSAAADRLAIAGLAFG